MTGFAAVEGAAGGRGFTLTMKAVNHRHLDLAVRVPGGLEALEAGVRAAVKAGVRRGHVEVTLIVERASGGAGVQVDEALLGAYVEAFRDAAKQFGVAGELGHADIGAMLRMPGVISVGGAVALDAAATESYVMAALGLLVERFNAGREAEGEALAAELRAGMLRVRAMADEASKLREGAAAGEVVRLQAKLRELAGGTEVVEERLLTEAAVIAARGDVEEELVRLRTHAARFAELLDTGGEVGRALDFLLQELNREANTLLSKSGGEAGLRLTEIGLAMKVELERAREQVQNLE